MDEIHRTAISEQVDYLAARLHPLTRGQAVALRMLNERGRGKKKNPAITLVPGKAFGIANTVIVVAIINNGSCILNVLEAAIAINCKRQVADLVRAGMPANLARSLLNTLKKVFGIPDVATVAKRRTRRTRRTRQS